MIGTIFTQQTMPSYALRWLLSITQCNFTIRRKWAALGPYYTTIRISDRMGGHLHPRPLYPPMLGVDKLSPGLFPSPRNPQFHIVVFVMLRRMGRLKYSTTSRFEMAGLTWSIDHDRRDGHGPGVGVGGGGGGGERKWDTWLRVRGL